MTELAALLIDLDGTLVHTADANYAAYAAALHEVGVEVDPDTFQRLSDGRHWCQFLPQLLHGSGADPAEVAARKRAIYPEMAARTTVSPGVLAMARLAKATVKLALVTTASRASVSAVLGAHSLEALFDAIVTGDDTAEPKPAPDGYLLGARLLGVEPAACLAIEDSDTGAESARRAGMAVLRVRI
jgi:HAD superfamily hydrolase (TIGR01509 family)